MSAPNSTRLPTSRILSASPRRSMRSAGEQRRGHERADQPGHRRDAAASARRRRRTERDRAARSCRAGRPRPGDQQPHRSARMVSKSGSAGSLPARCSTRARAWRTRRRSPRSSGSPRKMPACTSASSEALMVLPRPGAGPHQLRIAVRVGLREVEHQAVARRDRSARSGRRPRPSPARAARRSPRVFAAAALQRGREPVERGGPHRGQDLVLVAEVAVGRHRAAAERVRELPHADAVAPLGGEALLGHRAQPRAELRRPRSADRFLGMGSGFRRHRPRELAHVLEEAREVPVGGHQHARPEPDGVEHRRVLREQPLHEAAQRRRAAPPPPRAPCPYRARRRRRIPWSGRARSARR